MNILREIRLLNKKNVRNKYKVFILLYVLLIASTYAWYWTYPNVKISNLKGIVDSWEILYKYDDIDLEDNVKVLVDNFYPGKTFTETIYIYNMGKKNSYITFEINDVKVFDESKMTYLESTEGAMIKSSDNKIVYMFGNDEYPFQISYVLNRNYIYTQYSEDNPSSTPNAIATLTVTFDWDYEASDSVTDSNTVNSISDSNMANSVTDSNTIDRDEIDTQWGKRAFNYYGGTILSNTVTDSTTDSVTDSSTDSVTDSSTDSILNEKPAIEILLTIKGVRYEGEIPTA